MKIIVGLGNPGSKYKKTRHNIGFSVVEAIAEKYHINIKRKGFQGLYGTGKINSTEIMLFEPQTYMNLSGEAVLSVSSSKLEGKEDLLVVSDDFNIPVGTIRIRRGGSAGGHNGLRSIIENIGSDFARLRVGIASEGPKGEMSSFVLSTFSREEKAILKDSVARAVECAEMWLTEDIRKVMNRYN